MRRRVARPEGASAALCHALAQIIGLHYSAAAQQVMPIDRASLLPGGFSEASGRPGAPRCAMRMVRRKKRHEALLSHCNGSEPQERVPGRGSAAANAMRTVSVEAGEGLSTESNNSMRATRLDRRSVLMTAGAFAMLGAGARPGSISPAAAEAVSDASTPFNAALVQNLAQQLSTSEYASPSLTLPESFKKLGYDQFRDIRFRTDQAIWRGDKIDFELQLLPMGWLYNLPVEIWLVDEGTAKRLKADGNLFSLGPLIKDAEPGAPYGFSGFRVHGPINRPGLFRRVRGLPGRQLLPRRRPRTAIWALRARPRHQHRAAGRRRVPHLPRVLGREAEARRAFNRHSCAAR